MDGILLVVNPNKKTGDIVHVLLGEGQLLLTDPERKRTYQPIVLTKQAVEVFFVKQDNLRLPNQFLIEIQPYPNRVKKSSMKTTTYFAALTEEHRLDWCRAIRGWNRRVFDVVDPLLPEEQQDQIKKLTVIRNNYDYDPSPIPRPHPWTKKKQALMKYCQRWWSSRDS